MSVNTTLTELANIYGSDKGTLGPSPAWGGNNYTDVYAAYLEVRRSEPLQLLEIGLGVVGENWASLIVHGRNLGGASLKMWHDYLPTATIFGIDINPCAYLDNARTRTFATDQGDLSQLQAFTRDTQGAQFDVIIDDGSHRPDHQQFSLAYFFRYLRPGGLYFIEDLFDNGLGDNARGRHACDNVLNTRRVMNYFREYGTFPEPHALGQVDYLVANIECVTLHSPDLFVEFSSPPDSDPATRIRYRPGSEKLCVIRKR